jgi:hypothetical protein
MVWCVSDGGDFANQMGYRISELTDGLSNVLLMEHVSYVDHHQRPCVLVLIYKQIDNQ